MDRHLGLFRTASRSTRARFDRDASAALTAPWPATARPEARVRGLGRATPRRGRPHPHVVHEIANSGLTLSKLSVAASLLGDLVRGEGVCLPILSRPRLSSRDHAAVVDRLELEWRRHFSRRWALIGPFSIPRAGAA